MFNPSNVDRIYHFIDTNTRKYRAKKKQKKLNNTDFTIISNNCWGGLTYEEFGLPKNSPTIGCYFFSDDYIKFLGNFDYYITQDLQFITPEQSKNHKWILENGNEDCPIGVLDDVEIIFVHYYSRELAYDKWTRRVKRINRDNMIFKFSYQNHATKEHLKQFDEMELPGKKLMFVNQEDMGYKCGVYYPGFEKDEQIYNDTYFGNRYFDVVSFINQ